MAKTMKAKKDRFYELNEVLKDVPKQALEDQSYKIANFFRAVKKVLRNYLDEQAELIKQMNELIKEDQRKIRKLTTDKDNAKDEEKAEIQKQIDSVTEKANKKIEPLNNKANESAKALEKEEAEAVFDNEEFLFVEKLVKDKAGELFSYEVEGKHKINLDKMDRVFELFDNAE